MDGQIKCELLRLYISSIERKISFHKLPQFAVFSEFFMLSELNNTIRYAVLLMILENNILALKS